MAHVTAIYERTLGHFLEPIAAFLEDPSVSEVLVNGFDEIFVERAGRLERTDARFTDALALEAAVRNVAQFAGKRLVPETPSLEARLPDGSRVHVVQAPASRRGLCMAIRKFSRQQLDLAALVERGSLSEEAAEFLGLCVALAKNVVVSGGTGSGKTTLLNCLSAMIPSGQRIIVLEDSSELQLQQEHVLPFEAQPPDRHGRGGMTIRELLRASLRMRPDRIIVGECRGHEALDMIQAMTSGHSGSLSTLHANTPLDALGRLETMALMADVQLPLHALRAQVASAIDVVVQISRMADGTRRVTFVSEVGELGDDGRHRLTDLFHVDPSSHALVWTGARPAFAAEPWLKGLGDRIERTAPLWVQRQEKP